MATALRPGCFVSLCLQGCQTPADNGSSNKKALLLLNGGLDYKKVLSAVDDFPKHTDGRILDTARALF